MVDVERVQIKRARKRVLSAEKQQFLSLKCLILFFFGNTRETKSE